MTLRTIIDILRKGNQELFHSSIIAWLLDPAGEHGFGVGFLNSFAQVVERNGCPKMLSALKPTSTTTVGTETTARKSRYDIRLETGQTVVVIENKTKSLGEEPQFEKYKAENAVLIALGLCDLSFSEGVKRSYPVVTYTDVLAILDRLPEPPHSDFRVLVGHYRQFLRRELALLSEIDRWYTTGAVVHAWAILDLVSAAGTYTENDRRFLNLYLLERLRRDLLRNPKWKNCRWEMDKNMQSGVWLALFDLEKEPGIFRYEDSLAAACREHRASVWFHVELRSGVLAKDDESTAGIVQLRCQTNNAKRFLEEFRKVRPCQEGENSPARLKNAGGSFYLLASPLLKKHLAAAPFKERMEAFAMSFGRKEKQGIVHT
jgi:hypothetical protein